MRAHIYNITFINLRTFISTTLFHNYKNNHKFHTISAARNLHRGQIYCGEKYKFLPRDINADAAGALCVFKSQIMLSQSKSE